MTRRERIADALKTASWLNAERIRLWARAFAAVWLIWICFDFWSRTAAGITSAQGQLLGEDFINLWAGAKLAVEGKAASVYHLTGFYEYQQFLAGAHTEPKNYAYPPTALLLSLPLAALPYIPALLLWSLLGFATCVYVMSRTEGWRTAWLAVGASPAAFLAVHWGQNGLWSAALLAGGMQLLEKRPVLAGVLFGFFCYKPQLAMLVPLALAAGGYWRAFVWAAATAIALTLLSLAAFGMESWQGFAHMLKFMRLYLEDAPHSGQPTAFTAVHLLMPGEHVMAYAAQIASAVGAAAAVFAVWRGKAALPVKNAALALATFLATPYAWNQDMVILTFAALWIAREARAGGFLPWEKFLWMLVILLPIPIMPLAEVTNVSLAPFILWAALALTLRRAGLLTCSEK